MIIPRGGKGLHQLCKEQSTIPVITGGMGICHIYVDASANFEQALDIIENAKVQRPSVCNALDTLLVHQSIAEGFLPRISERLTQEQRRVKSRRASTTDIEIEGKRCRREPGQDRKILIKNGSRWC